MENQPQRKRLGIGTIVLIIAFGTSVAVVIAQFFPNSTNPQPAPASATTVSNSENQITLALAVPPKEAPPPDDGIIVAQSSNSQNDPYAAEAANETIRNFRQSLANAEAAVREVYFAAGCHVFSNSADALPFFMNEIESLNSEGVAENIVDPNLEEQMKSAGQDGVTISQQPGACDYWHKNPEALNLVRHEVELAELR